MPVTRLLTVPARPNSTCPTITPAFETDAPAPTILMTLLPPVIVPVIWLVTAPLAAKETAPFFPAIVPALVTVQAVPVGPAMP